jgi:hypothetical protein
MRALAAVFAVCLCGSAFAQGPVEVGPDRDGGAQVRINLIDRNLWESYLHLWDEHTWVAIGMHVMGAGVVWGGLELYDQMGESSDDADAAPVSAIPPNTTINADTVVIIGGDANAPVTTQPNYSESSGAAAE